MSLFLKLGAYLFHPMTTPTIGVLLYYLIAPHFLENDSISSQILAIFILTFLVPLIAFFLLKNLRLVNTIHLKNVKERKIPLMIQSILLLFLIRFVIHPFESRELYFFFLGVLGTTIAALILVLFSFKVSLHQMAISGLGVFFCLVSLHFEINILWLLALLFFANGWVATSRLHTKSHTLLELMIGFFIGAIPQLLLVTSWL